MDDRRDEERSDEERHHREFGREALHVFRFFLKKTLRNQKRKINVLVSRFFETSVQFALQTFAGSQEFWLAGDRFNFVRRWWRKSERTGPPQVVRSWLPTLIQIHFAK